MRIYKMGEYINERQNGIMYDKTQVWIRILMEIKISEIKANEIAFKVKIPWNNYTIKMSINQMRKLKSKMELLIIISFSKNPMKWNTLTNKYKMGIYYKSKNGIIKVWHGNTET